MKITVARPAIAEAMKILARIVESRTTIPILSHARLIAAGGHLKITTSDTEIEVTCDLDAETHVGGGACVSARLLADIVARANGGEIRMEMTGHGQLSVKGQSVAYRLDTLPAEDFPVIATDRDGVASLSMPGATLATALTATVFAAGDDPTRFYLMGVYLTSTAEETIFVAVDGHRLSRWARPRDETEAYPSVIIPTKTARLMAQMAADRARVDLEISETKIRATFGRATLISKLIDGTFPDFERVIPREQPLIWTVPRAALAEAIERTLIIAGDKERGLRIGLEPDCIHLSSRKSEGRDTLDLPGGGTATLSIGAQGRFLTDALAAIGGDQVVIRCTDPQTPLRIERAGGIEDGATHIVIVMPLRLPDEIEGGEG